MNTQTEAQWLAQEFADAHQASTPGTWKKGRTTHHTVTDNSYAIGEFHHAADAQFCDTAHKLAVPIVSELRRLSKVEEVFEYFQERSAQRHKRLWQWAHEELSEPLKTRYFNIVANGTADVHEEPTYAQQYNSLKNQRDSLEAANAELLEALEEIAADYEDRFDMNSPSTNPGIKQAHRQAHAAIAKHQKGTTT